jgi:hypothetical protein
MKAGEDGKMKEIEEHFEDNDSLECLNGLTFNTFIRSLSKRDHFLEGMKSIYDISGELYFNDLQSYRGSINTYFGASCGHLSNAFERVLKGKVKDDKNENLSSFRCLTKK